MFVQHLRSCQIKILLRDVHSPLPKRIHSRFGAYTFQFGAGAAVHLLGNFCQVDAAGQVHGAGVDAEDVGAGFDSVLGKKRVN